MPSIGQHIFIRLRNDRVIAPTTRKQRIVARSVLSVGRDFGLLAFSAADTHLHMENVGKSEEGVEFARRVKISLWRGLAPGVRFREPAYEEIKTQSHLYNTFTYILKQDRRHDLSLDPLRDASNLPDLLGLRLLGRYTSARVRQHLPRIKRAQLLECLGLEELVTSDDPLDRLVPAAAAAVGRLDLTGRTDDVTAARRAVIEIAGSRLGNTAMAHLLGVSRRTVCRLRSRPVDARLLKAVRLQVALHQQRQLEEGAFTEGGR